MWQSGMDYQWSQTALGSNPTTTTFQLRDHGKLFGPLSLSFLLCKMGTMMPSSYGYLALKVFKEC